MTISPQRTVVSNLFLQLHLWSTQLSSLRNPLIAYGCGCILRMTKTTVLAGKIAGELGFFLHPRMQVRGFERNLSFMAVFKIWSFNHLELKKVFRGPLLGCKLIKKQPQKNHYFLGAYLMVIDSFPTIWATSWENQPNARKFDFEIFPWKFSPLAKL